MNTIEIKNIGTFKVVSDFYEGYNRYLILSDSLNSLSSFPINDCLLFCDETCYGKVMILKKVDNRKYLIQGT